MVGPDTYMKEDSIRRKVRSVGQVQVNQSFRLRACKTYIKPYKGSHRSDRVEHDESLRDTSPEPEAKTDVQSCTRGVTADILVFVCGQCAPRILRSGRDIFDKPANIVGSAGDDAFDFESYFSFRYVDGNDGLSEVIDRSGSTQCGEVSSSVVEQSYQTLCCRI